MCSKVKPVKLFMWNVLAGDIELSREANSEVNRLVKTLTLTFE